MHQALAHARDLARLGVHKQLANRLLEPFAWHTALFTATEWSNFGNLRCSKDAQPEIRAAAELMFVAMRDSVPRALKHGEWHLPYVSSEERMRFTADEAVKISAARCARVSYLRQEGIREPSEDLELYDRLVGPGHLSPLEHPCRPMTEAERDLFAQPEVFWNGEAWERTGRTLHFLGNVNGWIQHRKLVRGEADILGHRARVERARLAL